MLQNEENNGTEEMGLVAPTPAVLIVNKQTFLSSLDFTWPQIEH